MTNQSSMDAFRSLSPRYKEQLIYEALLDGSLSFTRLSNLYVQTLEEKAEQQSEERANALGALAMSWNSISKRDQHSRKFAAETIVKSGFFEGAPIHEKCVEYLYEPTCSVCHGQLPCECG